MSEAAGKQMRGRLRCSLYALALVSSVIGAICLRRHAGVLWLKFYGNRLLGAGGASKAKSTASPTASTRAIPPLEAGIPNASDPSATNLDEKPNTSLPQTIIRNVTNAKREAGRVENFTAAAPKFTPRSLENISSPKINVWFPYTKSCSGSFVSPDPDGIREGLTPVLMLREATVDLRHNSKRELNLRKKSRLVKRIVLQISVAREAVLLAPGNRTPSRGEASPQNPVASFGSTLDLTRSSRKWKADIAFVLPEVKCVRSNNFVPTSMATDENMTFLAKTNI